MSNLTTLYAPKQLEVLSRVWSEDFFICGLHGAKRSGKTVVNNDVFISELNRVREIADELGVDEPMYILAGTSSTSIQNNVLQELYNKYDFWDFAVNFTCVFRHDLRVILIQNAIGSVHDCFFVVV